MRKAMIAAVMALPLLTGGCAAALVGGIFYDSVQKKEQKQKFTQEFQARNVEREKAGLPPLDWCSESYKFDKDWAATAPGCAERIRRYEGGDASALKM